MRKPDRIRAAEDLVSPPVKAAGIALLLLVSLLPVAVMLLTSVTPDVETVSGRLWPSQFAWGNYLQMWQTIDLARGLLNSLILSLLVSSFSVALAAGLAYCIARFDFPGRGLLLGGMTMMRTVPGTAILLPIFATYAAVQGWIGISIIGTMPALVLTYLAFTLPLATWLIFSYIQNLPVELEEAGLIDGLTRFGTFVHIVLPLARPGLAVAFIFGFLTAWNDVLFALILTVPSTATVTVELTKLSLGLDFGALPLYGQLMGACVIASLPVVLLSLFLQRHLVTGSLDGAER